uniref:Uncharacterized protein n=1 Tax=Aegilops tauschii TaxID=37682 RepID=M8CBE3_AEGTA
MGGAKYLDELSFQTASNFFAGTRCCPSYNCPPVEKVRIEAEPLHNLFQKHNDMSGLPVNDDLDIPESVGLSTPQPSSVRRLVDSSSK